MDNKIIVFTDGSTLNNQGKNRRGGIGVFFKDNDPRNLSLKLTSNIYKKTSNNVCEILACCYAIEILLGTQLIGNKIIYIHTDSNYVINSITKWADGWKKNNWRKKDNSTIENLDIIQKLYYYYKNLNVMFKHVRAHKSEPNGSSPEYFNWYGNNQADKLAVEAAKR